MIDLNTVNKIYLFTGNTDFRYGIYGLSKIVLSQFNKEDIKHNLYLFCSKSRKCIKILEFENNGVWMYYKKLDVGKFIYPQTGLMGEISRNDLEVLLNGLDFVYKIEGTLNKKYDIF